jgi:hypothetical protein
MGHSLRYALSLIVTITITKSQGLLKEQAKTLEVAGDRGRGSKKAQQAKRERARDGGGGACHGAKRTVQPKNRGHRRQRPPIFGIDSTSQKVPF